MAEEMRRSDGRSERDLIKDAVSGSGEAGEEVFVPSPGAMKFLSNPREQGSANAGEPVSYGGYEGMQPSILGQEQANGNPQSSEKMLGQEQAYNAQQDAGGGSYPADYQQQAGTEQTYVSEAGQQGYADYQQQQGQDASYAGNAYGAGTGYQQYQPYQEGMGSDVITEISEQVVDERLSTIKDRVEQAIDFKTAAEAKLNILDKRLKRIEQIIDILQISLIQKVSEYVTDVKDMKNELVETQKSFKALAPHAHHSGNSAVHHPSAHHEHANSTHHTHPAHHAAHKGKKTHHP